MNDHWRFIQDWIKSCRHTANTLSHGSGEHWRARDVEMAVFTAQRSGLPLNPLG